MKKIVLIGYMGVGKTTIGKMLADRLKLNFLDLDEIIEHKLQKSVSEIFKDKGEIYFRKIEHEVFTELLSNEKSFVLSLGGGTPCYANNHELLRLNGVESFYLKASIETLYTRLKNNVTQRPLLANQSEEVLKDFIAKQLFERSYFYFQSKFTIAVDELEPVEVLQLIENHLA